MLSHVVVNHVPAAIVVLVGVFIYLWNTNEGFRNFFINAWQMIKDFFYHSLASYERFSLLQRGNGLKTTWAQPENMVLQQRGIALNKVR